MPKHTPSFTTNNLLHAPAPLRLEIPKCATTYITLVGCGGTGSHIASGLGALVLVLKRETAVRLTLMDPDRVEMKNVGRQLFTAADIGKYKAHVLAQRLADAYGITSNADARGVDSLDFQTLPGDAFHLVVGAVDNPAARSVIANAVKRAAGALWWLDGGNELSSGQALLGNIADARQMRGAVELGMVNRLPAPQVVYPDLIQTPRVQRARRAASCAENTAAGTQGLMVNRMVAAWALELAHALLVTRDLKWFGQRFELRWGNTSPLALDVPTLAAVTGLSEKELTH